VVLDDDDRQPEVGADGADRLDELFDLTVGQATGRLVEQ
jgi:hypothetical protein